MFRRVFTMMTLPAALLAAHASQSFAADLPVAVEPIDYVRICDAYGKRYYYIPGTDTCLRIGGRVRADYNVFSGNDATREFTNIPENDYRFRARGYIYMRSASETDLGTLKTETELRFTRDNDAGTSVDLYKAYVELHGLRFGRDASYYEFRDLLFSEDQQYEWAISKVETNQIRANFEFGSGFSAGVAIEDAATRNQAILGTAYAGEKIPDVVGRVRYDGGLATLQLSGATHYVESLSFVAANPFANGRQAIADQSELGFAVTGAGLTKFKLGGRTIKLGAQAAYAKGVLNYLGDDVFAGRCFGGCGTNAINARADAVIDVNGNLELSDIWAVGGGFAIDLTDKIYLGVNGSYLAVDQANVDAGALFNIPGPGNTSVNLDYANIDLQGYLRYRPVDGMDFGAGVEWKHTDMKAASDFDALSAFFRAQRTF